uniref:Glycogen debranching enzyme n=1 Tax=Caenorhabditis tropicalis TaxID=1561998 RepID=A0A1I7U7N9_9PELO
MTKNEGDEVRIIVLEAGQHLESVIRKVEKGWIVRFKRGASLLGKQVTVETTLSPGTPLKWSEGQDHLSVYCEVKCQEAGSFRYSFHVENSSEEQGSGYFLVMPGLEINGKPLELDGICCQTYLTKLLGPLPEWKNRLRVAMETGYNMIHLTPIHELGISNSSYSLSDHHGLGKTIGPYGFQDIQNLVDDILKEWGILTVQDVVWNHAAKNATWLMEHPESSYNCLNSPHLRPAYVIDRVYHEFGKQVGEGIWEHRGIPSVVENIHHVNAIEYLLRAEILPKAELHEFYQVDLKAMTSLFEVFIKQAGGPTNDPLDGEDVEIVQDPEYRRFGNTVDFERSARIFNRHRGDAGTEEERVSRCVQSFHDALHQKNLDAAREAWEVILSGLRAVMGGITYERIADNGPKKGLVSEENPLTTDYFLHLESDLGWKQEEKLAFDPEKSKFLMAFNGWVMSSDPMKNFALKDSQVYLRRELVCWGDSVKLNYGEKEEDSPFLWKYMKEYTQQAARIFHGLRIDNAHGTPIHVAERLLKTAREIRPDIYVFAELFTGSEHADNMFVNRLGISSLIREAQSAGDSHEQGRLVYRYGGDCVGAFKQKKARLAPESIAHGLFLDQSHDNPSPIHTRSPFDILPTAGMLSMASCAIGSTRGYDELVRDHIHVVHEKRPYASWDKEISESQGIIRGRKILNRLHTWLAENGYNQVFVDQMNPDIVGITRHNPITHETVVVVSHTAFSKNYVWPNGLKHIPVGGVLEKVLFEMKLNKIREEWDEEDQNVLRGLENFEMEIRENVPLEEGTMFQIHGGDYIELTNFPSGSVIGFKIRPTDEAANAFKQIHQSIESSPHLDSALSKLIYQSFPNILFHCESEDYATIQQGGYDVPNFGKFVYCGLQGLIPVLEKIRDQNDLGHPLCQNLRDGTWLCDYITGRLAKFEKLGEVSEAIKELLGPLEHVPYYLRPAYFEVLISHIYGKVRKEALKRMAPEIASSSALVRHLAISTLSFLGYIPGAGLAPIPTSLQIEDEYPSSLAAGLSHFAVGIWRNWGRDTFIALPGCLLSTGRLQESRQIILSFAGSLRHGLIPNLLAEGIGARYNCRDATWFWLVSIVKYVEMNGEGILKDKVRRIYPSDDTVYGEEEREETLIETIYEALDRHFNGIDFRERNAGPQIDEQMRDEGFQVTAGVCRSTGFIRGGNRWNCGTWMDKMGSSERAGNKGEPATPRDGAAVELQGLAYRILKALDSWKRAGLIERGGVSEEWTWSHWAEKIRDNFQKHFYVEAEPGDQDSEYVNRREIIKDSFGSSQGFTDFQLRPNFAISLAVSPEIMDPKKAWKALDSAECLLGPLGIKTLDPTDWGYNGYYNNDDDGEDKKTAKGWNYHQGPEWLFVAGFYLQARLQIGEILGGAEKQYAIRQVQERLGSAYKHIIDSPWRSLPELTNANGEYCRQSCDAQAWSVGCLIEACIKLNSFEEQ